MKIYESVFLQGFKEAPSFAEDAEKICFGLAKVLEVAGIHVTSIRLALWFYGYFEKVKTISLQSVIHQIASCIREETSDMMICNDITTVSYIEARFRDIHLIDSVQRATATLNDINDAIQDHPVRWRRIQHERINRVLQMVMLLSALAPKSRVTKKALESIEWLRQKKDKTLMALHMSRRSCSELVQRLEATAIMEDSNRFHTYEGSVSLPSQVEIGLCAKLPRGLYFPWFSGESLEGRTFFTNKSLLVMDSIAYKNAKQYLTGPVPLELSRISEIMDEAAEADYELELLGCITTLDAYVGRRVAVFNKDGKLITVRSGYIEYFLATYGLDITFTTQKSARLGVIYVKQGDQFIGAAMPVEVDLSQTLKGVYQNAEDLKQLSKAA